MEKPVNSLFWRKLFWLFLVLLLVFSFSFHSLESSWSQDLGRHLKIGEIILKQKAIPKINLFSSRYADFPFQNHHWLAEVIFYLVYANLGEKTLLILKVFLFLISFGLIFKQLAKKEKHFWLISLAALIPLLVFRRRTDLRPEIFGFFFFSIYLIIFAKARQGKGKWLWLLPFLQCLWVNSHISFVFGLFLLGLNLIKLVFKYFSSVISRNKENDSKGILPIVVAILASFINPFFWRGVLAPFLIWQNYGYQIVENQSIFFLNKIGYDTNILFFEIGLVIFLASFVFAKRILTLDFLGWLILSLVATWQIRHFPFWALYSFWVGGKNFLLIWDKITWSKRRIKYVLGSLTGLVLFFYSFWYFSDNYYLFLDRSYRFGWSSQKPVLAGAKFLKDNFSDSVVFNNFDIGSFLDYYLYPEMKIWVDSRPEAFPEKFWQEYRQEQNDWTSWQALVKEQGIEVVFFSHTDQTPWARSFLSRLYQSPLWRLVYLDNKVVIFTNKNEWQEINLNDFNSQCLKQPAALVRLASFFDLIGEKEMAKLFYEKALGNNPFSYQANYHLAKIYLYSNNEALIYKGKKLNKKTKNILYRL